MELSARDKRILADIECEEAVEDPRWVRRFERLRKAGGTRRHGWRRAGFGALVALVLVAWLTAVVLGIVLLRPVLWAALAVGVGGITALVLRRRHLYGSWHRPRRRISRIPRQNSAERGDNAT